MWAVIILFLLIWLLAIPQSTSEKFKPSKWHHRTSGRPYDSLLEFPHFLHPYDYVPPFSNEFEFHPYGLTGDRNYR